MHQNKTSMAKAMGSSEIHMPLLSSPGPGTMYRLKPLSVWLIQETSISNKTHFYTNFLNRKMEYLNSISTKFFNKQIIQTVSRYWNKTIKTCEYAVLSMYLLLGYFGQDFAPTTHPLYICTKENVVRPLQFAKNMLYNVN